MCLLVATAVMISVTASAQKQKNFGYPITPVPFTQVKVAPNTFWGQRIEASFLHKHSNAHIVNYDKKVLELVLVIKLDV